MSRSHGVLPADACSVLSLAVDEPLAGTAPHTRVWIGIEQSGPWGSDALLESHLPSGLGVEISDRFADPTIRTLLLRRPGTHADARQDDPALHGRTVLVAFTGIDGLAAPWLVITRCIGDEDLAAAVRGLDPASLLQGIRPGGRWSDSQERPTLICTNGRRDTCCAISGRLLLDDVVAAVADTEAPSLVWECSHPGGHRFAPTVVLLPSGLVLGRATANDVAQAMEGALPVDALRGRSSLTPAEQAAEIAVLTMLAADHETSPGSLTVSASPDPHVIVVRAVDNRTWSVPVREVASGLTRPVSCGKEAESMASWIAHPPVTEPIGQDVGP